MIHYHGTPFSGDRLVMVRALRSRHAMITFADPSPVQLVAEVCQSFTVDNGAFSAWKSGGSLDVDAYAAFIEQWHKHPAFDWYIMPDVIDGSANENADMLDYWCSKYAALVRRGVPVWHMHEPTDWLTELVDRYPTVALGSSGDFATVGNREWWSRMAQAMTVACDALGRPRTKLHGLRMLDPTVFSHLPLSSADSTNVARNCGIDSAWSGPYVPRTKEVRATILMERIEAHASAARWSGDGVGVQQNLGLFG